MTLSDIGKDKIMPPKLEEKIRLRHQEIEARRQAPANPAPRANDRGRTLQTGQSQNVPARRFQEDVMAVLEQGAGADTPRRTVAELRTTFAPRGANPSAPAPAPMTRIGVPGRQAVGETTAAPVVTAQPAAAAAMQEGRDAIAQPDRPAELPPGRASGASEPPVSQSADAQPSKPKPGLKNSGIVHLPDYRRVGEITYTFIFISEHDEGPFADLVQQKAKRDRQAKGAEIVILLSDSNWERIHKDRGFLDDMKTEAVDSFQNALKGYPEDPREVAGHQYFWGQRYHYLRDPKHTEFSWWTLGTVRDHKSRYPA